MAGTADAAYERLPVPVRKSVEAWMATLAAEEGAGEDLARTLVHDPQMTIEPTASSAPPPEGALTAFRASATKTRVRLEALLGEGGMGAVYSAEQVSLGRKVAVKIVHPDAATPKQTKRLLQEAWVTAQLEHPNILPVYDIAEGEDGEPLILLKRIDGVEWGELMHEPETLARRYGVEDPLEWNLRVLMQVADAVHFAHVRGFLHRDIKPENVMIGEHGEVYVADWGIALTMRDEYAHVVPHVRGATHIAGTPAYMAPEMLGGEVPRLGPATDVYLLGAVLFELLAERPPHVGSDLREMLGSILGPPPEVPEDVPAALRTIIERALSPDPDGRFETPHQLRLAVEGYLRHRGSERICDRALSRLATLEALLDGETEPRALAEELPVLIAECRFGFREALAQWPDNERARAGLERALTRMAEHELAVQDPKAARGYLAAMSDPPTELVARLESAEARQAEIEKRRAELERDTDIKVGMRTRTFIAAILGFLWTVAPLVEEALTRMGAEWARLDHQMLLRLPIFFLVLLLGFGVWARESLMATRLNRGFFFSFLSVMTFEIVLSWFLARIGLSVEESISIHFGYWAATAAVVAAALNIRLLVVSLGYALGAVLSVVYPELQSILLSACNFILTFVLIRMGLPVLVEDRERRLAERRGRHSRLG